IVLGEKEQRRLWTEKQHSIRVLFIPPFDAEVDYIPQPELPTPKTKVTGESDVKDKFSTLEPILVPNQVDEKHGTVLIPALTHKESYLLSTRVNNEGSWPVQVRSVQLMVGPIEETSWEGNGTSGAVNGLEAFSRLHSRDKKKSLMDIGVHIDVLE